LDILTELKEKKKNLNNTLENFINKKKPNFKKFSSIKITATGVKVRETNKLTEIITISKSFYKSVSI